MIINPVTWETLEAIRDDMVMKARMAGYAPDIVTRTLDRFIADLRKEMSESGTVFYQP